MWRSQISKKKSPRLRSNGVVIPRLSTACNPDRQNFRQTQIAEPTHENSGQWRQVVFDKLNRWDIPSAVSRRRHNRIQGAEQGCRVGDGNVIGKFEY